MMPNRRLSVRTLTASAACLILLSGFLLAIPIVAEQTRFLAGSIRGYIANTTEPNSSTVAAPTAVLLSWNTFGNSGTETTEGSVSNDPGLLPSNLTKGAGVTGVAHANRFGGNAWWDAGDSTTTTLQQSIAGNDYLEFVVSPNPGVSFTPTSLVFKWELNGSGPKNVSLRSSVNAFASDLGAVLEMPANINVGNDYTIVITGLADLTSSTTFRLYGYGATAATGAGGFDVSNSAVNVALNGSVGVVASTPEISVAPSSMSFGAQPAGTTGGTRSVTITNSGTGSLNIGQLVKAGANASEFTITADPSNTVIAPGGTAKVRVTFSPTGQPGSLSAEISIPSNDSDEPTTVVSLSGTATAVVTPDPVKSLWVWGGSPNPVTDPTGRADLIQRASAQGITDLYVSVYQPAPNAQTWLMYPTADVAALTAAAHSAGMKIWYTSGDPAWQGQACVDGQSSYERMQEVVAYNGFVSANERFDGVMLDVEPGAAFNVSLYVGSPQCYRGILPAEVKLGTAINAFWEDGVEYPAGGETKPEFQHIIDYAPLDQIVVMGYRDNAGIVGGNGIIGLDEDEIGYASSIGKAGLILAGLETKDLGVPAEENVTFFEEGDSVLRSESAIVASHFASSSAFGGFSIHAYGDEYLSGVSGWPSLPPAPQVATASATLVTGTSAALNGSANPNGTATAGYFYYGTHSSLGCTSLGSRMPTSGGTELGSGTADVIFSQAISGLAPATTYYFCAVADNPGGTATGTIFSVTTVSPPSELATANATNVTAVTATLNGLANPNGAESIGYFRFDSADPGSCSETFGTRAPTSGGVDLGSGSLQVPYLYDLAGLDPSTTYYFCAFAQNSGGTSIGAKFSFTTAGVPEAASEPATSINAASAVLNGLGDPSGAQATGYFRYGTTVPTVCDDAYGTRAPASGGFDLGSGTAQVAFSQAITGLSPATTYYFCWRHPTTAELLSALSCRSRPVDVRSL